MQELFYSLTIHFQCVILFHALRGSRYRCLVLAFLFAGLFHFGGALSYVLILNKKSKKELDIWA